MELSLAERNNGRLEPDTLASAVQQVKMNGYVLFEAILSPSLVQDLHAQFMHVLNAHIAKTEQNRGVNRYQMHLPFMLPFINPLVIANPIVLAVIDALLGDDCVCQYFASDTPLPGAQYQKVHSDIQPLFPESDFSVPAYTLALNIPLVDFCPANGPIEIWPGGTHLMPGSVDMQTIAPQMHSETVLMPAGSLLVRDLRMWHRGTPNGSNAARPNMAMIYARPWMKTTYPPIGIPQTTYDQLPQRAQRLFRFEAIGGRLDNLP